MGNYKAALSASVATVIVAIIVGIVWIIKMIFMPVLITSVIVISLYEAFKDRG